MSTVLEWLFEAELHVLGSVILWREIVGNAFGLASAPADAVAAGQA